MEMTYHHFSAKKASDSGSMSYKREKPATGFPRF